MLVTFCVPTIPGRESLLSRCLFSITDQAAGHDVEVLVLKGTGGLGDKVNAAVELAAGDYVTVVDDDDWLSGAYLDCVTPALADRPDYVGYRIVEQTNGQFSGLCATSGESKVWDGPFRWPIPKGLTRTAIARQVKFGNEYTADRAWSQQVAALVRSSAYVDRGLYLYDFFTQVSFYYGHGMTRDVGLWPFRESLVRRVVVDR